MEIDFNRLIEKVREQVGSKFTEYELLVLKTNMPFIDIDLAYFYRTHYAANFSKSTIAYHKGFIKNDLEKLAVEYAVQNYEAWKNLSKTHRMEEKRRNKLNKASIAKVKIRQQSKVEENHISIEKFSRNSVETALHKIGLKGPQFNLQKEFLEKHIPYFPLDAISKYIIKNSTTYDINRIVPLYLAFHIKEHRIKENDYNMVYRVILKAFFESPITESKFNIGLIKERVHLYLNLIWKKPLPESIVLPENIEEVEIPWNAVTFLHKKISIINPHSPKLSPLVKNITESRAAYQDIQRIFERYLPPLRAIAIEGRLFALIDEPLLSECVLAIHGVHRDAFEYLKQENKNLQKRNLHNFKDEKDIISYIKRKNSEYFNHLCNLQLKTHSIHPCFENHGNSIINPNNPHNEIGFIFTLRHDASRTLLIYENDNPDRSSIIFTISTSKYSDAIKDIAAYFESTEPKKRRKIEDKVTVFNKDNILKYDKIIHHNINSWKSRINEWLK